MTANREYFSDDTCRKQAFPLTIPNLGSDNGPADEKMQAARRRTYTRGPMPTAATVSAPLTPGELAAQHPITAYTLTPQQLHRAEGLHRAGLVLSFASTLFGFAVLAVLIAVRFGPKLQRVAECITKKRLLQAAIFVPALLVVLHDLPAAAGTLRPSHLARLRTQRAGVALVAGRLGQVRTPYRHLCHVHPVGALRAHPPLAAPLVVLRVAPQPAHHGRHGLRLARPHRPALQPLRAACHDRSPARGAAAQPCALRRSWTFPYRASFSCAPATR